MPPRNTTQPRRPARRPPPVHTEQPRDDVNLPVNFHFDERTPMPAMPATTSWIREVVRVDHSATGMDTFVGHYRTVTDGHITVRPGTLLIVCTHGNPQTPRAALEFIDVRIYLPGNIWYLVPLPDVIIRTRGWHDRLEPIVSQWIALSRVQRIIRACNEAIQDLENARHSIQVPETGSDIEVMASVDERNELIIARRAFEEILQRATADPAQERTEGVRRMFRDWMRTVEAALNIDSLAVGEIVDGILPRPTQPLPVPAPPETQHASVEELAAAIVQLSRAAPVLNAPTTDAEYEAEFDAIRAAVHELATTELGVLETPASGNIFRVVFETLCSRHVAFRHGIPENSQVPQHRIAVAAIRHAANLLAAVQPAPMQTVENRNARNIRLNRRRE